jgi:acyl-CoA thioesterase-1
MSYLFPRLTRDQSDQPRSYGILRGGGKIGGRVAAVTILCATVFAGAVAVGAERPVTVVALGDSLIAGYGLAIADAFPTRLQQALADKGYAVKVVNAGVSGDTAAGGLARLDWSVPDGTDAIILELGANDALRGFEPAVTRKALDTILGRLAARRIPVLLCGMLAPPNLGAEYGRTFNAIYPDLAAQYGAILYPFFLSGVAADPILNQRDGLHPTAAGVGVIIERILPTVEQLIGRAKTPRS